MILTYIPMLTNKKNVQGCSVFNRMRSMIGYWLDKDPDLYVVWVCLTGVDYGTYLDHPRILKVKVPNIPYFRSQFRDATHINTALLDYISPDRDESLFYHAILSDIGRSSNYLISMIGATHQQEDIPLINFWEFPSRAEDTYFAGTNVPMIRSMYFGFTEGWNVFETSDHEKRMMFSAPNFLSASECKRIQDRTLGYMGSVDVDDINKTPARIRKERPFRIHISSRISSSADVEGIVKIVDNLYSAGKDVQLVITTQGSQGYYGGKLKTYMKNKGLNFELTWRCPQRLFYEISRTCHVCLENSDHGDFAASFFERVLLGEVGVHIDLPWITNILLPDYKFKYKDPVEMQGLLGYLYDNYDSKEVQDEAVRLRNAIIERYDVKKIADRLMIGVKELVDKNVEKISKGKNPVHDVADKAINSLGKQFSWPEYARTVKKLSDTHFNPEEWHFSGRTTKVDHIKVLESKGFKVFYDDRWILRFKK